MTQSVSRKDGILLETGTNELEIITFSLQWIDPDTQEMQRASYGINAAKVRELVAVPEEITAIADSPDCVMGVFLLRDRTIPLIDLSNWFRYEPDTSPETVRKWTVIVAEMNGKPFGFITHGVDKVYRVSWDQIKLPPEAIANCQTLTGMCLVDDQLIQMVDFERIIAAIDPTMNIHAGEERGSLALSPEFSSKKVFVADDSRTILLQLQSTVEQSGLNVVTHNDGQEIWDHLEELRKKGTVNDEVLAIISDIEMPRMDGHHFCKLIKAEPAYKTIPVILFSSMINDALRRKGEAVGADDQITKPEIDNIVERILGCLQRMK